MSGFLLLRTPLKNLQVIVFYSNFPRSSPSGATGGSSQNPSTVRAASVATQHRKRATKSNKSMPSNKEKLKPTECILGANISRRMSNP